MEVIGFDGGGRFRKKSQDGGGLFPTMGNPALCRSFLCTWLHKVNIRSSYNS